MPKLEFTKNYQYGLVHPLLLLVAVVGVVGVLGYFSFNSHKSSENNVEGVYLLAKGDDSGSSGGSDSSGGSGESSGGSTNTSSSGGSGSSSGGGSSSNEGSSTSSNSGSSSGESNTSSKSESSGEGKSTTTVKQKDENEGSESAQPKTEAENEAEIENEVETKQVSTVVIKNSQGELEIESKEDTASESAATSRPEKLKQLKVKIKHNGRLIEVEFRSMGGQIQIVNNGVSANTNFPLQINSQTGELEVTTPNGVKPIRVLPDQASQIAKASGIQNQIEKVELVANPQSGTADSQVFAITGIKSGNLFGFIPVTADVDTTIGAQTGTVLEVHQPTWLSLLSPLIN